jgi:RNA polymerase sigma-70 factor (ECF subfamily)
MLSTSPSLLERLRQPGDQKAWQRFTELYTPLLYAQACRLERRPEDAADLVQEVFVLLLEKLPSFHYDPKQSFRAWLRTLLLNKWRDRCRRRQPGAQDPLDSGLADPGVDPAVQIEEAEYRDYLIQQALRVMQTEFPESTWKACCKYLLEGQPAEQVAAELRLSVGSVYAAKSKVLARLRQELHGLLDET